MKRRCVFTIVLLIVAMSNVVFAINGKRVNGVGVFANWFFPFDISNPFDANKCPRGPIVKANISDNQVTSWDTLYDSLGQYPAINGNCSLVVFFRWAQNVNIDRTTGRISPASTPANKPSYLSTVTLSSPHVIKNLIEVNLQPSYQEF